MTDQIENCLLTDDELLAIWKRWKRETEFFAIKKVADAQLVKVKEAGYVKLADR